MKIVQIIPSLESAGGAEKFMLELSVELKSLGHNVTVISLYSKRGFYDNYISKNKLDVIYLDKKPGVDFKNSRKLKRVILNINPDIVHAHLHFHLSFFLSGLSKFKKIKWIETIHSSYTKNSHNFILKKIIKRYYVKKIIVPISISDEVAKYTKTYFKLKQNLDVIYNGINLSLADSSINITKRECFFITVGRLVRIKNQTAIIEATKILSDEGYKFTVTIVGDGPEKVKLKTLINEYNLNKTILLLGQRDDVFKLLANHRVFLLPSFEEGNPLSIIEAMASGLVVIATKIGGPVDIVTPGKNGYLVDPYDIKTLVNEMKRCLDSESLLGKISINNIADSSNYSITKTATEYVLLYKEYQADSYLN